MGLILGYLCLICFVLLLLKTIARKCHLEKLNQGLMKIHKYVAFGMLLLTVLHLIFVWQVLKTRAFIVNASGVVVAIIFFAIVIACHRMRATKRRHKWHFLLSWLAFFVLVVHIVTYFIDFSSYQRKIGEVVLDEFQLENISDGEYYGSCDVGYIYAKVKVVVNGHKISDITLIEHRNERGAKAEKIIDSIISKQTVDVDAVSGATNSSKVIKKAIADALTKG